MIQTIGFKQSAKMFIANVYQILIVNTLIMYLLLENSPFYELHHFECDSYFKEKFHFPSFRQWEEFCTADIFRGFFLIAHLFINYDIFMKLWKMIVELIFLIDFRTKLLLPILFC